MTTAVVTRIAIRFSDKDGPAVVQIRLTWNYSAALAAEASRSIRDSCALSAPILNPLVLGEDL